MYTPALKTPDSFFGNSLQQVKSIILWNDLYIKTLKDMSIFHPYDTMTFVHKLIPLQFPSTASFEILALNSYCNTVNVSAVYQMPSAKIRICLIKQKPKGTRRECAVPDNSPARSSVDVPRQ